MWQQVDLVDEHEIRRTKHHRILQRLFFALGHSEDHRSQILAHHELRGTHQIADVLDDDEVEFGERQARQRRGDHRRVQMALPTEPVAGVDQCHRGAEPVEAVRVEAGLDVSLDDPDPAPGAQPAQRPGEQGRLPCARRGHQVHDDDPDRVERRPVRPRRPLVLPEDALEYLNPFRRRAVTRMVQLAGRRDQRAVRVLTVLVDVVGMGVVGMGVGGMGMETAHLRPPPAAARRRTR
ncbi:hypothetical protein FAGKG844_110090 [Frankia sp. AgKG'84/4]